MSTLGMALYNGWKMTLVVLAGLPIIRMANRIQQNEADASVEPEGVEAVCVSLIAGCLIGNLVGEHQLHVLAMLIFNIVFQSNLQ